MRSDVEFFASDRLDGARRPNGVFKQNSLRHHRGLCEVVVAWSKSLTALTVLPPSDWVAKVAVGSAGFAFFREDAWHV
jgi:hypothetical protein